MNCIDQFDSHENRHFRNSLNTYIQWFHTSSYFEKMILQKLAKALLISFTAVAFRGAQAKANLTILDAGKKH